MVPRNRGRTGTYLLDALYPSLECRYLPDPASSTVHILEGRVIQIFAPLITGSVETGRSDFLNHGMLGTPNIILGLK